MEENQQSVYVSSDSGKSAARRLRFWRSRWLWAFVVVIVLLGAAAAIYEFHQSKRVTPADVNNVQNQADVAVKAGSGGTQAGLKVYNNAISNATDSQTRAQLNLQAADLALNSNMPDTALNYALQADDILHDPDSSSLVASIYQQKGDSVGAVTYYKKAAAEVPPSQHAGHSSQYYLQLAQEVNGGAQ